MSKKKNFSRNRKENDYPKEPLPVSDKEESPPKKGWLDSFFADEKSEEPVEKGENPETEEEDKETEKPEFLNSVRDSIINLNSYVAFKDIKTTTAFGFIGLVLLLVILLYALNLSFTVIKLVDNLADFYKANIPVIVVKDGKATVQGDVKMPLEVNYENPWGNIPIIVDTTGVIKNLEKREQGILITGTDVFLKLKDGKMETIPLSKSGNSELTIDENYIREFKKGFFSNLFPIIIVFWYMARGVVLLIQILIFALIGMYICKYSKVELTFKQMINLCIYASVPALIILMVLDISGAFKLMARMIPLPAVRLSSLAIYYFAFFLYLYNGVERIKKSLNESTP